MKRGDEHYLPTRDKGPVRRFVREFKPEQIKHYLAKEVIARYRTEEKGGIPWFVILDGQAQFTIDGRTSLIYDPPDGRIRALHHLAVHPEQLARLQQLQLGAQKFDHFLDARLSECRQAPAIGAAD